MSAQFPADYFDSLPAIPRDWRATHWGNDVCPSWSPSRAPGVRVWVDHADPDRRECPGARFTVTVDDEDENAIERYHGDDWAAVLATVDTL